MSARTITRPALFSLVALAALASGCRQDMHDQPKYKVNGWSEFFADHRNNRPLVPNTVARGRLMDDDLLYRGRVDGKHAEVYPMQVTAEVLERGRNRYSIFCLPCHSPQGDGNGVAVQRGMKRPPSIHIDRLQKAPPGYFYDVITNGFGSMYDYSDRTTAEDRWAIVAYVQTLQASQNTRFDDLSAQEKAQLMTLDATTPHGGGGAHGASAPGGNAPGGNAPGGAHGQSGDRPK